MPVDTKVYKTLLCVVCYNSDENTRIALNRIPQGRNYDVLIIDDGSSDKTAQYVREYGFVVVRHEENKGLGAAIKTGAKYALDNGYDIFVVMAGNNKDDPREIPRLMGPIIRGDADYVQGSRFLAGGKFERPPFIRRILVRVYVFFFKLITGFRGTDAINGFRAYRVGILKDSRINIWQEWLNRYGYETYLYYKVLKLGYKIKEVPVTKSYASFRKRKKYSHVRPLVDWWDIARPILYLKLRIKK